MQFKKDTDTLDEAQRDCLWLQNDMWNAKKNVFSQPWKQQVRNPLQEFNFLKE